jgi:hypothetical protein
MPQAQNMTAIWHCYVTNELFHSIPFHLQLLHLKYSYFLNHKVLLPFHSSSLTYYTLSIE